MPRETVHDQSTLYDVQVGWQPGQAVQVGVETTDGRTIVDRLLGEHMADPKIRAQIDSLFGQGQLATFTGLWATLDREGCNRLIRLVRQARDKAYGRDE